MNEQIIPRRIDTGDFVGSAWTSSPIWTPYARGIAAHYPIQVPLFLTTPITLSNVPADLNRPRVVLTRPQLYDSLIFGMSFTQNADINTAGQTYLNITHQETGIPWVAPNTIGFAPLPAFAGYIGLSSVGFPVMFISKLPDAFFLPRGTQLKLEFLPTRLDVTPAVNIILNMYGVQLINHAAGSRAPETVTMPNGETIRVGSRLPWFGCVPFGARPNVAGLRLFFDYELNPLEQTVAYGPPSDCDVEVHDTYASFLDSADEFSTNRSLLRTKVDDTRIREDWTPQFVPVQAVYGSLIQLNPTMPYVKPQILQRDHKILVVAQNNNLEGVVDDGTVTFRGVRRCEY
jgi:hypothetical protein